MSSSEQTQEIVSKVTLYVSVARYDLAEKTVRSYLEEQLPDEDLACLHNLLGMIFHRQSLFSEASREFEKALQYDPSYLEALLNHAVTLCDTGQYAGADRVMKEAPIQVDKSHCLSYLTLSRLADKHEETGDQYLQCGMPHRALIEYKSSNEISHLRPRVRLKMAEVFMQLGSRERAHKELTALLDHAETHDQASALLGVIAFEEGDHARSISYWSKFREGGSGTLAGACGALSSYLMPNQHASSSYSVKERPL